mgnify:CR=1 FL=1
MRRSDSPGNADEVRRINLMFWVTPHENELIRRRMAQAGTAKDKQTKRSSSLARGRGEKRGRTAPGTARRDEIN